MGLPSDTKSRYVTANKKLFMWNLLQVPSWMKETIAMVPSPLSEISQNSLIFGRRYQKFLREQGNKSKNMLAICASCKSIRDKNDGWTAVEDFFTDIVFSHGICPDCCEKLYPGFDIADLDKDGFDI